MRQAALPIALAFLLGALAGWLGHGILAGPGAMDAGPLVSRPAIPPPPVAVALQPETTAPEVQVPEGTPNSAGQLSPDDTPSPAPKAGPRPEPPAAAPPAYVGNTRSRIFHRLDSRYATCKHCTEYFANREEALAAGYTPSKTP